jgi:AcrR family transcriptional regulator
MGDTPATAEPGPAGSGPAGTGRRPGRPRSPGADEAILDAALRLLARDGYARMTVDAVAAEAGVGKATVYLRFRSKADLATAALAHLRETGEPESTGDVRRDCAAILDTMRRNAERLSAASVVGTCLAEERHMPELLGLLRERIVAPRRAALRALVDAAVARGEVAPGLDAETAVDLMMGAYLARHLSGDPHPPDWAMRVVRTALPEPSSAAGA